MIKKILISFIILLTAIFTVGCSNNGETFDITLDANGGLFRSGEDIYQIKDTKTSDITLPSDPSKDGFVFSGWFFDDQTFSNPFSLDVLAEKDASDSLTIYAKWETGDDEPIVKTFTITFETNGGTSISPITFNEDDTVLIPNTPTKVGHIFDGWYLDPNLETSIDTLDNTLITEDFTVYANWVEDIPVIVTEGLTYAFTTDNTYEVTGYTGTDLDVYIPETHLGVPVTRIGRIESTTAFTNLHLSKLIKSIDDSMFSYPSLTSITVSPKSTIYHAQDGVLFDKEMNTLVWFPQAKATSYIVPEGVEHIGEGTFRDNPVITSITLPSSLKTIEDKAFWGTESLKSINIPDQVTSIGWNAFYVSGLEIVTFGSSLESIARGAFAGTDISSITLPNTMISIGEEAFAVCNNLTNITIHATTPPSLGVDAFRNMSFGGYNETLMIYVPINSVNLYKESTNWDNYIDIITNIAN